GYQPAQKSIALTSDSVRADLSVVASVIVLEEMVALPMERKAARARQYAEALDASAAATGAPPMVAGQGAIQAPPYRVPREPWNTESYAAIDENAFLSVHANPLSTFSIDVDRASYSNIRRFLNEGRLPPKDAVRIEEMVNYFPYSDVAPEGEHPVAITTEVIAAPWQQQHYLMRIGLQAPRLDLAELPPNNLVFLFDVSGSMMSPDKLPLLKQAMRLLVNEL